MQTSHLIAEPASRSGSDQVRQTALWTLILLAAVVRFWLLPLRSGFWLDETGTAWAIRGTVGDVIAHCLQWPSQMPLYSLIEWAVSQIAGMREWALRLPSVFAMAGAAWMLYRLGRRLLDRQAALLATVIFACSEPVYFAAADARPYALGVASVIGSTLLLIRWFESGRKSDAILYCLVGSFMLHMHYTFGTALVVHAGWMLYRVYMGTAPKLRIFTLMMAAVALSVIPSWPHLKSLFSGGGIYGFAATPRLPDLFALLTPPLLVCSLLAALLLSWLFSRNFEFRAPVAERSTLVLLLAWTLVPALFVYAVSVSTGLRIFLPRYLLTCIPGLSLLAAWAATAVRPREAAALAASFVVIFSVFSAGLRDTSHGGDWRQAAAAVNRASDERTPVLVRSGFVESTRLDWAHDRPGSGYLFAPLAVYPVNGYIVPLPYRFNSAATQYLEQWLSPGLQSVNRLVLLTSGDDAYELWISGHLANQQVTMQSLGHFGGSLRAFIFHKPDSGSRVN